MPVFSSRLYPGSGCIRALRLASGPLHQLPAAVRAEEIHRRRAALAEGAFVAEDKGRSPVGEGGPAPLALFAHLQAHGSSDQLLVMGMYPGCVLTRSIQAPMAGKRPRSKPPSSATWV